MASILVFLFGLICGSFLNVVIWRIPRKESLVTPGSHCPTCQHPLGMAELIPVASYLRQGGRCRHCASPISWTYPVVELLTAGVFLILYQQFDLSAQGLFAAVLSLVLISVTFTDLALRIIPNAVLLAGFILGTIILLLWHPLAPLDALLGLLVVGGLSLIIAEVSKGGFGYGDVKLAALIGFYQGWQVGLTAFFLAIVLGALVGAGLILTGRKKRKDTVPFGPFLALGTFISLFYGQGLVHWYLLHL